MARSNEFSWIRDYRKVDWGSTLLYNHIRSAAGALVWFLLMIPLSGKVEWSFLALPLGYAVVILPTGLLCKVLAEKGVPFIGWGYVMMSLLLALGDPLLWLLDRARPGLLPVEKQRFFDLQVVTPVVVQEPRPTVAEEAGAEAEVPLQPAPPSRAAVPPPQPPRAGAVPPQAATPRPPLDAKAWSDRLRTLLPAQARALYEAHLGRLLSGTAAGLTEDVLREPVRSYLEAMIAKAPLTAQDAVDVLGRVNAADTQGRFACGVSTAADAAVLHALAALPGQEESLLGSALYSAVSREIVSEVPASVSFYVLGLFVCSARRDAPLAEAVASRIGSLVGRLPADAARVATSLTAKLLSYARTGSDPDYWNALADYVVWPEPLFGLATVATYPFNAGKQEDGAAA